MSSGDDQQDFEFQSDEDSVGAPTHVEQPQTRKNVTSPLLNIPNGTVYNELRQVVSDNRFFEREEGSPYWSARVETAQGRGRVQLKPDLNPEQPLVPVDHDGLAQRLWDRLKSLSDLQADVLDILVSSWLAQAKTRNDRACIDVDDLIAARGIKPKRSWHGHHGGYTPDQRLAHLQAASVIFDLWINMNEVVIYRVNGRSRYKCSVQSRPFVVTDRAGAFRLFDEYMDVRRFTYLPGEVFAAFLMGTRPTALLSARALAYNPRTQQWHKRLTRYYSYIWGCAAAGRVRQSPVPVAKIFSEGLRAELNSRYLSHLKERFGECHRALNRDQVLGNWHYEQTEGPWGDWTVVVEPPDCVRRSYEDGQISPSSLLLDFAPDPSPFTKDGELIRARRESAGLTQRGLAQELKIPQSTLSRVERGKACAPEALRKWLSAS